MKSKSSTMMSRFHKIMNNPAVLSNFVKNICTEFNKKFARRFNKLPNEDFLDLDWDVLIILDAAHPTFLSKCNLPEGKMTTKISSGSESWEFMQHNFLGKTLHDTVYVSANPHTYKLEQDIFFRLRNLLSESWEEELGTVPPSEVIKAAIEEVSKFPNKRHIIHFMQPHFPFIGKTGMGLDSSKLPQDGNIKNRSGGASPWTRLTQGEDIRKEVLKSYEENHHMVCDKLPALVGDLEGKVVITADHANLIGQRGIPIPIREYGHPPNYPVRKLREVPWLEINSENRPEIIEEHPIESQRMNEDDVQNHLEALGYR